MKLKFQPVNNDSDIDKRLYEEILQRYHELFVNAVSNNDLSQAFTILKALAEHFNFDDIFQKVLEYEQDFKKEIPTDIIIINSFYIQATKDLEKNFKLKVKNKDLRSKKTLKLKSIDVLNIFSKYKIKIIIIMLELLKKAVKNYGLSLNLNIDNRTHEIMEGK